MSKTEERVDRVLEAIFKEDHLSAKTQKTIIEGETPLASPDVPVVSGQVLDPEEIKRRDVKRRWEKARLTPIDRVFDEDFKAYMPTEKSKEPDKRNVITRNFEHAQKGEPLE